MSLQRVSVAVPLAGQVDPEALVPVFHEWIREGAVEGLLIDVARYAHVHHGPGVMLVGHEGDYSVDLAGGRPSLRYTLKRDNDGSPAQLVARAARRLDGAARLLEESGTGVTRDEVTVRVYDRLRAPNTPETAQALTGEITAGIAEAFGPGDREATLPATDEREPFTLVLRSSPRSAAVA